MNLLKGIATANRDRVIRTCRALLLVLRGDSTKSKYADEVLRFLMQQTALLSEKRAVEVFFGMVVNTAGKSNSYFPADLRCEYLVKTVKDYIKHLTSNKNEANIEKWTGILAMLEESVHTFDVEAGTCRRSGKHTTPSAQRDEEIMGNDLRDVQPFHYRPGREINNATSLKFKMSMLQSLDYVSHHKWISKRIQHHIDET